MVGIVGCEWYGVILVLISICVAITLMLAGTALDRR